MRENSSASPFLASKEIKKVISEHLVRITQLQKTLELEEKSLLRWIGLSKQRRSNRYLSF